MAKKKPRRSAAMQAKGRAVKAAVKKLRTGKRKFVPAAEVAELNAAEDGVWQAAVDDIAASLTSKGISKAVVRIVADALREGFAARSAEMRQALRALSVAPHRANGGGARA